MISKLKLLFSIFIFVSVITLILFIVAFFATKKFNNKYRHIFAMFIDVDRSRTVLYASILLNFLLSLFFLLFIDKYDSFGMQIIIVAGIISCLVAFNARIILNTIIHTAITVEVLWLLRVVDNYLNYVLYDTKILVLRILFTIMIGIYIFFVTIRKIEISLKINNKIRR